MSRAKLARRVLDIAIVCSALCALAFVLWVGFRWASRPKVAAEPELPAQPIELIGDTLLGSPNAKVGVIEFSDFECPYCGRFAKETHPEIEKAFVAPGRVLWAFSNLPIESLHPHAFGAAQAAVCAGRKGQFWPMYRLLFSHQDELGAASIDTWSEQLHLASWTKECDQHEVTDLVRKQIAKAVELGVFSTPTFFIGTVEPDGRLRVRRRLSGAQPFDRMSAVLESFLR